MVPAQGSGQGRGPEKARETWGEKCQSREPRPLAPPPAGPGSRARACAEDPGESGSRDREEAPTRTGTRTRAALPTARSSGAGPTPGHLSDGDRSAPETAATRTPADAGRSRPPRADPPAPRGGVGGARGAEAPATEPGRRLERLHARLSEAQRPLQAGEGPWAE